MQQSAILSHSWGRSQPPPAAIYKTAARYNQMRMRVCRKTFGKGDRAGCRGLLGEGGGKNKNESAWRGRGGALTMKRGEVLRRLHGIEAKAAGGGYLRGWAREGGGGGRGLARDCKGLTRDMGHKYGAAMYYMTIATGPNQVVSLTCCNLQRLIMQDVRNSLHLPRCVITASKSRT